MALSRRKFTQAAGAAIVGIGFAGSAAKVFSQTLRSGDLYSLTGEASADLLMSFKSDTFLPYLGTVFHSARSERSGNSFRLTEVVKHQHRGEKLSRTDGESFSLFFRSVGGKNVPQDVHIFEHPSLGTFSLFIAPVERGGKIYEAVISRLSLL